MNKSYLYLRQYVESLDDLVKNSLESDLEQGVKTRLYLEGFLLSQILVSCEFQGVPCNLNDFFWFHDYEYGNCFRFNGIDEDQSIENETYNYTSQQPRLSTKPGYENGLRLELFSGNELQQQFIYKTGFRVIVHNQSRLPLPDEDGIDVPAGKETNIGISRTFIRRLDKPYTNCIHSNQSSRSNAAEPSNEMLKFVYAQIAANKLAGYQQNYCLKVCYAMFLVAKCQCVPYSLKFLDLFNEKRSYCSSESLDCVESAEIEFSSSNSIVDCYSQCPIECELLKYNLDVNWADYPTRWYVQELAKQESRYNSIFDTYEKDYAGPTYDLLKQTTSLINVYYKAIRYTVLTEQPAFSFDSLVANVGSYLVLFSGGALLSFVPLVELIVSLFIAVRISFLFNNKVYNNNSQQQ